MSKPIEQIVTAVHQRVIQLVMYNRSVYRDEYDTSGDWDITTTGMSLDEAITKAIVPYFDHVNSCDGANIDSIDIHSISRIKFQDHIYYIRDEDDDIVENVNDEDDKPYTVHYIVNKIINTELYKKMKQQHIDDIIEQTKKNEIKRKNEIKQRDLAKLKELQDKYPENK